MRINTKARFFRLRAFQSAGFADHSRSRRTRQPFAAIPGNSPGDGPAFLRNRGGGRRFQRWLRRRAASSRGGVPGPAGGDSGTPVGTERRGGGGGGGGLGGGGGGAAGGAGTDRRAHTPHPATA